MKPGYVAVCGLSCTTYPIQQYSEVQWLDLSVLM